MRRADAIDVILRHRAELAGLGVAHLSLFGSVARDEAGDDSDLDAIVDGPGGEALGLFGPARIGDRLEVLLRRPVDVVSRRGLDHASRFKVRIAGDIVDVF